MSLFRFDSIQDFRDATQVIADADQGGLGLPDRDYYLKDDAKSEELRKAYVAHVQKMFELLGDKPETAAAGAQTVMRIETALAQGLDDAGGAARSESLYHKMTSARTRKTLPGFRVEGVFRESGPQGPRHSLNVAAPNFFQGDERRDREGRPGDWKSYLRWHLVHANARYLSTRVRERKFRFLRKDASRATSNCSRAGSGARKMSTTIWAKRSGRHTCEKYFSAEAKQQALKMVKEIEAAMEQDIETLPWMSAATKQQALEKLHGDGEQDRVSRQVARLQQTRDRARR